MTGRSNNRRGAGGDAGRDAAPLGRRLARGLAIGVGGLVAALLVARASLPLPLAKINPILAEQVAPGSGTVLARKVDLMMRMPGADPDALIALSRKAVQAEPMEFSTASNLGVLLYFKNRRADATELFTLVGGANLRDRYSHAMLLQNALDTGQPDRVIYEAEILLRQRRSLEPVAFEALTQVIGRGISIPELAARLAENPSWRTRFLAYLGTNGAAPEQELKLYRLLANSDAPPTGEEIDIWLLRQSSALEPARVSALWRELLPRPLGANERTLRGGDMEANDLPRPFNWIFYVGDTGFAEREQAPLGDGQSLFVEFRGGTPETLARQWTNLAPGRYVLGAKALSPFSISQPKVALVFFCIGGASLANIPIGITRPDEWRALRADIAVPANCPVQSLEISVEGRPQGGYQQLYLDDFSLTPAVGGADRAPAARGTANP